MQDSGYFSSKESPIGVLSEPIAFNFLLGESGWRAKQQEVYRQLQARLLHFIELYSQATSFATHFLCSIAHD